jgi:hypothetical protein
MRDGPETRQTLKLQTRSHLFDVELYLTVHKSLINCFKFIQYYSTW